MIDSETTLREALYYRFVDIQMCPTLDTTASVIWEILQEEIKWAYGVPQLKEELRYALSEVGTLEAALTELEDAVDVANDKLGVCVAALVAITTLETMGKDREAAWTALEKVKGM